MEPSLEKYKKAYLEKKDTLLKDFITFLKFPSISTLKEHKSDILNCADWVKSYLSQLNFKTEVWETSGHPTIYAENLEAGADRPTLLLYQHYDVQPVDPLELWHSPPFEPKIEGDVIYARGAQDNKGQAFYVFTALQLLLEEHKKYPINIKIIVEGEEETGSLGLSAICEKYKERLKCDYFTIIDVDIPDENTPAINMSTRGMLSYTVEVTGSNTDLHSGLHGGLVYNPLRALSEALTKMYNEKGEVTLPGFYDEVKDFSNQKNELYLDLDEEAYQKEFEATPNGGEKAYSPRERIGLRPTFEINGIWGGYNQEGFKTVIPAKAFAKVSMRLVPRQDPHKISQQFQETFPSLFPEGMRVHIQVEGEESGAFLCPFDSKAAHAATKAYTEVFGSPCKKIMGGGSLPIAKQLQSVTTENSVAFGLGLSSDKIHAPNEHFSLSRLEKGTLIVIRFIEELARG